MKKIGIITFHDSRNYGAVLQTYALEKKLRDEFKEIKVEVINYQNDEIKKILKLWNYCGNGIKEFIKALITFIFRLRKKKVFNKFLKKEISLSKKVTNKTIIEYAKKYDIVITGSDQIWNTNLTSNDVNYFLKFCDDNQKKVSYAASFGDKKVEISAEIEELISKFDYISLREDNMLNEIKQIARCPVNISCDPSLLLNISTWKQQSSKKLIKERYLFLFMIDDSKELKEYAQKYANMKKLKLISNKKDFNYFCHLSPSDFLSWILYADCIITNSFHGTVFSVLFHKNFVSHLHNCEGLPKTRIINFLKEIGLSHRNTDNVELNVEENEDWNLVDENIKNISNSSWQSFIEYLNS